jgi:hypothetical protein
MEDKLILYPIFPLLALTCYVLFRTFFMRVAAVKSGAVSYKYYRLYDEGEETPACRANTRHLANLLEIPPIFYITCILIYVTGINSILLLSCAWSFVLSRYLHTYVHLGRNKIRQRYLIFWAGGLILILMWVVSLMAIIRL